MDRWRLHPEQQLQPHWFAGLTGFRLWCQSGHINKRVFKMENVTALFIHNSLILNSSVVVHISCYSYWLWLKLMDTSSVDSKDPSTFDPWKMKCESPFDLLIFSLVWSCFAWGGMGDGINQCAFENSKHQLEIPTPWKNPLSTVNIKNVLEGSNFQSIHFSQKTLKCWIAVE